jgi:hypothetical protein
VGCSQASTYHSIVYLKLSMEFCTFVFLHFRLVNLDCKIYFVLVVQIAVSAMFSILCQLLIYAGSSGYLHDA